MFEYLRSVYGKKSLVGQNKFGEAEKAFQASGKWPAIISVDLCGWHQQRWSDTYRRTLQRAIDRSKAWYLVVNQRKLDNLIWVYSSALKAGGHGKDVEAIEYRRRFYPGDRYVDIAGIDIYINAWFGWPHYEQSAYRRAWDIIRQIAPDKMHALCECQGIPDPDLMAADAPVWLYCLPWYVGGENWNPPEWVEQVYQHELMITLDQLPSWRHRPQQER